jgi:hypothetical protein
MSEFKFKDAAQYEWMWKRNGVLADGQRLELKDALATSDAAVLLPKVISNIVKEAAEPLLVGTSLLQRITYKAGQQITFPAVGAMEAADIPEGGEYLERNIQIGGATVTANIGKSGMAVRVTEEMIRYSQYDVIGMLLRGAGRAMARHKEKKIFKMIASQGQRVFDNLTPAASIKGVMTGRSLSGAGNGSVTMDDLFDTIAQVMLQGFTPNTLLMHPLTWVTFVKDPTLRAFALASGGGTFFASWQGSPAGQAPWANSSQGGLGVSPGQNLMPGGNAAGLAASDLLEYPQTLTSRPVLPSYFGLPMSIIVSPFVPFDTARKLTDIYVFDRNELGALIVDEEITTEEFRDPRVDILKIKIRERYALAMLNEAMGCAVMKNVHIVPNEIVLPATASIDVSTNLAPIGMTDSVL